MTEQGPHKFLFCASCPGVISFVNVLVVFHGCAAGEATASAPRWIATPHEKWVRVETASPLFVNTQYSVHRPHCECSITAYDPTPAAISWIGTLQVLLMMIKFVTSACKFYLVIASSG